MFEGVKLRKVRQQTNLTQEDIASAVGISVRTVKYVEANHKPTIATLKVDMLKGWW